MSRFQVLVWAALCLHVADGGWITVHYPWKLYPDDYHLCEREGSSAIFPRSQSNNTSCKEAEGNPFVYGYKLHGGPSSDCFTMPCTGSDLWDPVLADRAEKMINDAVSKIETAMDPIADSDKSLANQRCQFRTTQRNHQENLSMPMMIDESLRKPQDGEGFQLFVVIGMGFQTRTHNHNVPASVCYTDDGGVPRAGYLVLSPYFLKRGYILDVEMLQGVLRSMGYMQWLWPDSDEHTDIRYRKAPRWNSASVEEIYEALRAPFSKDCYNRSIETLDSLFIGFHIEATGKLYHYSIPESILGPSSGNRDVQQVITPLDVAIFENLGWFKVNPNWDFDWTMRDCPTVTSPHKNVTGLLCPATGACNTRVRRHCVDKSTHWRLERCTNWICPDSYAWTTIKDICDYCDDKDTDIEAVCWRVTRESYSSIELKFNFKTKDQPKRVTSQLVCDNIDANPIKDEVLLSGTTVTLSIDGWDSSKCDRSNPFLREIDVGIVNTNVTTRMTIWADASVAVEREYVVVRDISATVGGTNSWTLRFSLKINPSLYDDANIVAECLRPGNFEAKSVFISNDRGASVGIDPLNIQLHVGGWSTVSMPSYLAHAHTQWTISVNFTYGSREVSIPLGEVYPCGFKETYQNGECVPCGPGEVLMQFGRLAADKCHLCGIDNQQYVTDAFICADCPVGKFSTHPVGTSCRECTDGYTIDENGRCVACKADFYSSDGGECQNCNKGTYSSPASSSCSQDCPEYSHFNVTNCEQCPSGKFSTTGSTCDGVCPAGTELLYPIGTDVCSTCPLGKYRNDSIGPLCTTCEDGLVPNEDHTGCIPCGIGTYFKSDSSSCVDCGGTEYTNVTGATVCSDCGQTMATNHQQCVHCPRNSTSRGSSILNANFNFPLPQACKCDYRFEVVGEECQPCRNNTAYVSKDDGSCMICESDQRVKKREEQGYGFDECDDCPVGKEQNKTDPTKCEKCPTGKYRADGNTTCIDCALGSEPLPGSHSCEKCQKGFYGAQKGVCLPCPSFKDSITGATSINQCVCGRGNYTIADTCKPCPTNIDCGDPSSPRPDPGHMIIYKTEEIIAYACTPPSACDGHECVKGYNGETCCAKGYTGETCRECDEGFFRLGLFCHGCDEDGSIQPGVLAMASVIVCCLLLLLMSDSISAPMTFTFINVTFLQTTSIFSNLDVKLPDFLRQFFRLFDPLSFDIQIIHPECHGEWNYTRHYLLTSAMSVLPIPLCALAALVRVRRLKRKNKQANFKSYSVRVLAFCYISIYAPLTASVVAFFDCSKESDGGRFFLDSRPDFPCYEDEWFNLLPVAIFLLFIFVLGVPVLVSVHLWRIKGSLSSDRCLENNRFLLERYKPLEATYYWEIVVVLRKIIIAVVEVFNSSVPQRQMMLAILVLLVALSLQTAFRPYRYEDYNRAEFISLFANLLTAILLTYYPGSDEIEVKARSQSEMELVGGIIVFLNVTAQFMLLVIVLKRLNNDRARRREMIKLIGGGLTSRQLEVLETKKARLVLQKSKMFEVEVKNYLQSMEAAELALVNPSSFFSSKMRPQRNRRIMGKKRPRKLSQLSGPGQKVRFEALYEGFYANKPNLRGLSVDALFDQIQKDGVPEEEWKTYIEMHDKQ